MVNDISDIECIKSAASGHTEAFAFVVKRYSTIIYRLVRRVVNNDADAQEVVQDCFVAAWQNAGCFRGDSSVATWLYRIAYNKAVSHVRGRKTHLESVDERLIGSLPDQEEQRRFSECDFQRLEKAVERLTPQERAMVEMFYRADMSINDIAEVTELSAANVKVILHRTRKKLAILIENGKG